MKGYAVLYVPDFRLQATLRYQPHLSGKPVALLDSLSKKPRVVELNSQALKARVETGMTPTQARARCPQLHLLFGNAGHERAAHDVLLQSAECISPFLEATAPGIVTIEWPSERPYDENQLTARVVQPLRLLGLETQVGVSTTPFLAQLVAQHADPIRVVEDTASFLSPLPPAILRPAEEIRNVLVAWGIRTIGDLTALPKEDVCERLGPDAVELWENAAGGRTRPLNLVKVREYFCEQADLENPLEMLEPLLFLLRRFLEQIMARLENVFLVVGKLRLGLRFESGAPYQRVFTIPQPTRDVEVLFRMLYTHLENYTSGSPIIAVELAAKPVRPGTEQFGLLEKGPRDPNQLSETLARLEALLGIGRVGTPELEPSRHPDAYHFRAYDANAEIRPASDAPAIGMPWLRFHPPIPAQVVLNGEQPAFLYSSRFTGRIQQTCGPWRTRGNWWEARRWAREEWDAATDEGIYRLVHTDAGWFLDGIYA